MPRISCKNKFSTKYIIARIVKYNDAMEAASIYIFDEPNVLRFVVKTC